MTALPVLPGRGMALLDATVLLWLRLGAVLALGLLLYVIHHWRIALPSFDAVDYHGFLARAIEGQWQWDVFWQLHNGVHRIPWPRLLWVLDLQWVDGQGWLVTAASALAVFATVCVLWRQLGDTDGLTAREQRVFRWVLLLFLASPLMAECLLNPINSQWSWMALGVVLLARGVHLILLPQTIWRGVCCGGVGGLLAWLNAAPASVLLLAAGLSLAWCRCVSPARARQWLLWSALTVLLAVVSWECLAWRSDQPLLLAWLYQHWVAPADAAKVEPFIRQNAVVYVTWGLQRAVFMGQYLLLTLGKSGQPAWWLASVGVGVPCLLWWRMAQGPRHLAFWWCLCVFGWVMGVGAALFRFTPLYDYRHANIGFLVGFSVLVLLYSSVSAPVKWRVLQASVLLYVPVFLYAMAQEAGSWAWEGSSQIREQQIGAAVGVQDPARFAYVWKDDAAHSAAVEADRAVFRQHHKGIYASAGYALFAGERALPTQVVTCDYTVLDVRQHYPDPVAFRVRGRTQDAAGHAFGQALFLDATGTPVGWAAGQLASDRWLTQWQQPLGWGGHLRLRAATGTAAQPVDIVAYDDGKRCQPHRIMLPAATVTAVEQ